MLSVLALCAAAATARGFGPAMAPRRLGRLSARPAPAPSTRVALFRGGGGGEAQLHIAGKLYPALRASIVSGERLGLALSRVLDAACAADLGVVAALWLVAPAAVRVGRCAFWRAAKRGRPAPAWETSYAWLLARGCRRLATTMAGLYALDLVCLAALTLGLPIRSDVSLLAASFAYPFWLGRFASNLKRRALGVEYGAEGPSGDGRLLVYDRLADFGLYLLVGVSVLEILSLELGVAFTSLLALSGASSVVVALACQEPLRHVISGLLLTFNDKFRPAEEIMFGEYAGVVTQMGWFDTKVRLYSERTVVVPNGKLLNEPLINFSRQRWGQYRTELRLRLEDAGRVDAAIALLKANLAEVPDVITQGRNLWVHWRRFDADAIVLVVDVKISEPGGSTPFYDAVQVCNGKIRDAVRDAGCDFCLPTSRRVPA